MTGLSVRGLEVRHGAQAVLQGVDLDVEPGELLVLLGPSGCGKSTLLHAIAGLVDASAGAVHIGGEDMTWREPSERGIGMVFQSYALYPTMTVERNLSFAVRAAGLPGTEVQRRVAAAAQLLQLEPLMQRKPAQLSGGQRQRVAIGRALVRQAAVYLFDEPLSNLDAKLRAELRRELKSLHRQLGTTMIYVTHDQVEAMTLATRIVVMNAGRIQQAGTPAEVYHRPNNLFVASFVGAHPMNLLEGRLRVSRGHLAFAWDGGTLELNGPGTQSLPVDGGPVTLGVRPEHVRIDPAGPFEGTVEWVEPMGTQQLVWLAASGARLAACADEAAVHEPNERVRLSIDGARVSLFDPRTGDRTPFSPTPPGRPASC